MYKIQGKSLEEYAKEKGYILPIEGDTRNLCFLSQKYKNSPKIIGVPSDNEYGIKKVLREDPPKEYLIGGKPIEISRTNSYPIFNRHVTIAADSVDTGYAGRLYIVFSDQTTPNKTMTIRASFKSSGYIPDIDESELIVDTGCKHFSIEEDGVQLDNSCFVIELQAPGGTGGGGSSFTSGAGGGSGNYLCYILDLSKIPAEYKYYEIHLGGYSLIRAGSNMGEQDRCGVVDVPPGANSYDDMPGFTSDISIKEDTGITVLFSLKGHNGGWRDEFKVDPVTIKANEFIELHRGGYISKPTSLYSGNGGCSLFGAGGDGVSLGNNGQDGKGYGAGGSGGASKLGGTTTGGKGSPGFARIWYYDPNYPKIDWKSTTPPAQEATLELLEDELATNKEQIH